MADEDDIISAPQMKTVGKGVIVQRPFGQMAPPQIGETGGFSVGASHLEGAGAVVNIALHHPDGETLLMTLGLQAFRDLATLCNWAMTAIESGQFDKPEVRQ